MKIINKYLDLMTDNKLKFGLKCHHTVKLQKRTKSSLSEVYSFLFIFDSKHCYPERHAFTETLP